MPTSLAGAIPGGIAALAALPVVLVVLALGWLVMGLVPRTTSDLELARILAATGEVVDAGWLPESDTVALFRSDGSVDFWSGSDGAFVRRESLKRPALVADCSAYNPTSLILYRPERRELAVWQKADSPGSIERLDWKELPEDVTVVTASGDGKTALVAGPDSTAFIWNVETSEEVIRLPFRDQPPPMLSADGKVAAGIVWKMPDPEFPKLGDNVLTVYSTETGEALAEIDPEAVSNIQQLALSADGTQIAVTSKNRFGLIRFNAEWQPQIGSFKESLRSNALQFVSDSLLVAVRGSRVYRIDSDGGKPKALSLGESTGGKEANALSVARSHDGGAIVVCAEEHKSAWTLTLKDDVATELSPLSIPEDVRNAK